MRARSSSWLAAAAALAWLACGGADDEVATRTAAPPESKTTVPSAPPARMGDDFVPAARSTPEPAQGFEVEDRIGDVFDTDPEGSGLDSLVRSARDDADASVREAAVIALGDSEDPRALDALIAASEDADSRVVLAAIDQLGWYDDRLAEDAIRRLVDSRDPEIAEAAREELDE